MIRDFLQQTFLFSKRPTPIEPRGSSADAPPAHSAIVDEVPDAAPTDKEIRTAENTRAQVIVAINWVLAIVLLGGFAFILVSSYVHPDRKIPEFVQNIVVSTIGYFGGSLSSYLSGNAPSQRQL